MFPFKGSYYFNLIEILGKIKVPVLFSLALTLHSPHLFITINDHLQLSSRWQGQAEARWRHDDMTTCQHAHMTTWWHDDKTDLSCQWALTILCWDPLHDVNPSHFGSSDQPFSKIPTYCKSAMSWCWIFKRVSLEVKFIYAGIMLGPIKTKLCFCVGIKLIRRHSLLLDDVLLPGTICQVSP